MKKFYSIIGILFLTLFLINSAAAQAASKMGYVDIQKVIFKSESGKQAINAVKSFQEKRQDEISRAEQELNQLEKDLSKQILALTDAAKSIKEEDIRKKKLRLKRLLEDSEYELAKRKKGAIEEVNKKIVLLIRDIGKNEGYSIILEVTGGNVIYANPALDLTDRIIAEFDKTPTK
ncbi:OmpH family outer membrane protein [candidate division CSSED10-310 bacterium]|uniref:OmpH family outer membrane protein n=1 Tax=candidate division CSSED10-310 bacterium TaxID=2855610 RepID=A0ABV6YY29_UNCC1